MAASPPRSARETQVLRDFRSASSFPTAPVPHQDYRAETGGVLQGRRHLCEWSLGSRRSGGGSQGSEPEGITPFLRPPTPTFDSLECYPPKQADEPANHFALSVGRLIGTGGMGRSTSPRTRPSTAGSAQTPAGALHADEEVRRFQREGARLGAQSPNIYHLQIGEVGRPPHRHRVHRGETLRERMPRDGSTSAGARRRHRCSHAPWPRHMTPASSIAISSLRTSCSAPTAW
jgi:hypothetical protein